MLKAVAILLAFSVAVLASEGAPVSHLGGSKSEDSSVFEFDLDFVMADIQKEEEEKQPEVKAEEQKVSRLGDLKDLILPKKKESAIEDKNSMKKARRDRAYYSSRRRRNMYYRNRNRSQRESNLIQSKFIRM